MDSSDAAQAVMKKVESRDYTYVQMFFDVGNEDSRWCRRIVVLTKSKPLAIKAVLSTLEAHPEWGPIKEDPRNRTGFAINLYPGNYVRQVRRMAAAQLLGRISDIVFDVEDTATVTTKAVTA